MTKLGFVGVGRHAQKLAAVFRELGCEVVGHIRADGSRSAEGFGQLNNISQAERVVVCCPPAVALSFARTVDLPMLVSKPLLATDPAGLEHVSVDLWRLWSPAWVAFKQACAGRQIDWLRVVFTGDGPFRETHSGALDYGPHALAFVHDLLETDASPHLYLMSHGLWTGRTTIGDTHIEVVFGNGGEPEMFVEAHVPGSAFSPWRWAETTGERGEHIVYADGMKNWPRADALRAFCAAWLRDETTHTLQLSCMGMRALQGLE